MSLISKIRITAKGWETFTGEFVGIAFEEGLSLVHLPRVMIDRIAALVEVSHVDDDGNPLDQAGAAARMVTGSTVSGVTSGLARATEEELIAEKARDREASKKPPVDRLYTVEELEAIAAAEGIEGIRKIANLWSVKDRSIPKLINALMKAQESFSARLAKRTEEERAKRQAALDESTQKQLEEEARMFATARVLTDQTPNAIGPDGQAIYIAPAPVEQSEPEQPPAPPAPPADEAPVDQPQPELPATVENILEPPAPETPVEQPAPQDQTQPDPAPTE